MSKRKEVSKSSKTDDRGGVSPPTAVSTGQKEKNMQRIEELLKDASPAFLAALLDLVARASGRGWQIKIIIEGIERVLDPESVASLLPSWVKLLALERTG